MVQNLTRESTANIVKSSTITRFTINQKKPPFLLHSSEHHLTILIYTRCMGVFSKALMVRLKMGKRGESASAISLGWKVRDDIVFRKLARRT